jgi:hypothetical protein
LLETGGVGGEAGDGREEVATHFYPTGDRMNLAWRTEKVTGDRKKVIAGRFNLLLRTVESDRRSEKSDARSLKSHLEDRESDRASLLSDLTGCTRRRRRQK